MISENKWKENMEKENLNKNNKDYIKDNTLSNDSNPLLMLLSASAILAGGALAYKRGFFKKPIQNTIKYASQFGKSDLNISSSIKAFNKWANIDNAESMYKNSIFRRDWSFEGVKDLVRDGNIKEAINDTKRDISNLIDKRTIYVNNFKKGKESNNRFYYQSELISELLDINRISNQYKKYPNGGALASKSKELMAKDLAQRLGVSKEVANGQLKRLGYRNLTLGDIYSTVVDKKTGKTKLLNINADFKFDEDSTRVIEEFLNVTTTIDKADNKSRLRYLIKTDKWKDFKVDSGLLINNAGEVADIRYAGRNTKEFIRTLANDYQIPMLNFNPLRFFGADKVGYKKNNYGIIHQSTIQSVLTGVPGRKTINQTKQFGNNPLLFVNGKVLRLEGEKAVRVKEVANNMKVDRMPKTTSSYGIRSDFNSLRKISGLNTKEYTLYGDEDGSVKSFFSKVMKKLDLGFQDRDASNTYSKIVKTKSGDKEVIVNTASSGLFDINGLIENTRNSILNKLPKPYKDTRESIRINQVFGTVRKDEDIYILRHKDTTLKDVITDKRADTLSRYYREAFAGRDNIKEVGDRALHTYSVVDRLNQTLSNIGLGLGMDSIGSSKEILTNLTLKRFLVVYGFYQTMQYVTMLTERGKEGREENKNIQTDVAEAFKVMDLSYHKLKDYTPITTVAKTLTDLLPGIDQVTELPGVSSLALDQTYEERKEYYENGMTPIRKGRYWGELGNSAFTGGKVSYYKPNLYRRIKGDVMFSDSKYGSREEYFDNAWFTSPIKHFVTDKYHYDIKHYEDRPYLVTGEEFKNVPIIGDTLASTVGNFIKPQRKMHSEYWNATNSYQDEGLKMIVDDNMQDKATVNLINGYKGVDDKMLGQQIIFFNNDDKKSDTMLDNRVVVSNFNTVNSNPNDYVSIDFMPKEKPIPVVYKTSAGINGLYQASSTQDLINLRKNINTITPDKATGVNRLSLTDEEKELNIDTSYLPNDIKTTLAAQYTNLTNLTGMTGYITETLTGTPMDNANILDTSNYAYSFNKVFWDQEFGGMGGALSEIYRRFAPEKNKDFNYINPIRNTMACLLPDTDVLLYNGTNKKADKIKVGDILMSNNGEATVVEKVKTYDANEIINIVLYGDNYHVNRFSWNHPIYMDNRKFKNAIDVRKGEYIAFPINKYLQNDDIMIDLSSYLVDEYDDITITTKYIYYGIHSKVAVEREIAEEYNFDIKTIPPHLKKRYKKLYNICRYQTKLKNNKPDSLKRIPRFISQNDFYYILGVYGAEGSENNKGISLKFSGHVEDKWEDELCKIFDKYNVKYSKIKSKKGIGQSIVTNCVPLNRILTNVCQGHSRTKKYLPCIYNDYAKVCESSIKKLIKGYIDGDGYSMKTSDNRVKVGLTTTSYNMAYQIRNMIINTINIVPNFSHSKSKFGDEFRLISSGILANKLADELGIEYNRFEYNPKQNNQKQYTDGEYVYIKVKDVFVENKKCSVIGYTVDGNHTFCTANIATHNTWIPGDTYFTDFTKGDPYTKVKWGEGRLPGEGYERLWGIKPLDMGIGSSFIGKSKEDIIKHLLYQDEITDEGLKEILDKGTSMHNEIEKKMEASGDAEQTEKTIYDKKHNVQGTYDVMLSKGNQYTGKKGIMDIKTVGDKKFKEIEATGEAKIENVSQVNFYLHNLNMNNGSILYVNRDNPEEQRVIKFKYSKELYESDMQKLEEARSDIMAGIDSGEIKRGDLYSPIDRVRILADVAPYSKEYQEAVRLLKNKGMTEEKEAELKAIEERVKKQKQPLRVYDYKFSTANLDERVVKVDKVLGKGLFTVKGEDGVSYKLGGIDYAKLEGVEQERALESILNEHISEGQKLTIKVDPDELKSKPSGINSTIKAIVVSRGTNLNKELVEKGFATTKDDNSPISVNVKYSGFSKTFGKVWEKFAHMDTYFNTKFLQVRSPLEHYKRNVVYGEDFQEWERPIENFLMPVINKTIERPAGLLLAGFIGAAFGRTKSAKLIGAAIGVGTIATGKVIAQTKETITGEKWKPSNRKHEEDVEEYLDKLTYVKNMKLFEEYSNKALQEDGFDVKEYQRNNEIAANSRKAKASKVERKKKELNYGEITEEQYLNSFESSRLTDEQEAELKQKRKEMNKEIKKNSRDKMIDTLFSKKTVGEKFKKFIDIRKDRIEKYKETDEYIDKSTVTQRKRNINKDDNENTQFRKITQLPENAIMALQYYQKAQETAYGYDYGENVQNLMKALPKTEKDFFKYFVKAPEEEREEILQVIPNYLKEPMMNLWGKHTDTPKESLEDYFSEHQLPDEEWVGWDEDVDLNSLKVKLVNEEGLEATNFNIWQDDIGMANSVNIPIPHMNKKFNRNKAKVTLERLLTESGYENVEVTPKSSLNNNIVLNIDNDTRYEVEQKLNEDYLF